MVNLFWPVYDDKSKIIKDSKFFPGRGALANSIRHLKEIENDHQIFPGSQIFWQSFIESKEVILIDKFFSVKTLKKIFHEFERNKYGSNPDLVIILCYSEYRNVKKEANSKNKYTNIKVELLPEKDTAYYIHDRFAIMDNKIWHFGSSVGGAEHHVNAFSGPWEDVENKFREYVMYLVERRMSKK